MYNVCDVYIMHKVKDNYSLHRHVSAVYCFTQISMHIMHYSLYMFNLYLSYA